MARSVFRLFAECVDRFLSKFWCCGRCELKTKMASVDFSGFHRNVGQFRSFFCCAATKPTESKRIGFSVSFFLGQPKTQPLKYRFRFAKTDRISVLRFSIHNFGRQPLLVHEKTYETDYRSEAILEYDRPQQSHKNKIQISVTSAKGGTYAGQDPTDG